jgi:hypothetical protein
MLSEQEKRLFIESTLQPMADHTLPVLTQVVGVIDSRSGELRGTGFLCAIAGRQAIVTAAHVVRELNEDERFQCLAFSRGDGAPPMIAAGMIALSDPYDLAIYLPAEDFPVGERKAFWPDQRIDRAPEMLIKDALFVHGFPRRFSRFTTLNGNAMFSESLAYGAMMRYQRKDIPTHERASFDRDLPDYEFLPDGFLEPHEFALNFWAEPDFFPEFDTNGPGRETRIEDWSELFRSDQGITPGGALPGQRPRGAFGLSGSPVWRIGAAGRSIKDWTPEWGQLVGVVTRWDEQERVLVATKATKILELATIESATTTKR